MKKILVIILGVILFTSCINDSTLDYKNLFVPECEFNLYEVNEPEFNED